MPARLFSNVGQHFFFRPAFAVGPVGEQGVPHVHDGEEAGGQWNLLAAQPERITGAVPFFVMRAGNVQRRAQVIGG